MDFYTTKENLLKLASKLFIYESKELTNDVDTEGMFDHIKSDIYGVVSFSPSEKMELENLNYERDNQGRDYFSNFLTVAIQAGVYLGKQQFTKKLEDELERTKDRLKFYKKMYETISKQLKKSNANEMPKGKLKDEIRELRSEVNKLKSSN